MADIYKDKPFFYQLLINPRYKIARHCLLLTALLFISMNNTFRISKEHFSEIGDFFYVILAFIFLTYLTVSYFNILYLVPRYLLNRKYGKYLLLLSVSTLILVQFQYISEELICNYLKVESKGIIYIGLNMHFVLDSISEFFTVLIALAGISVTIVFKNWLTYNQKIIQLENEYISSQVEKLKEQVTPNFLFNILNRTGILAKNNPDKASKMVMKLSQILRYELYDCNREKVLLISEIQFLEQYLSLEQLYSEKLKYTITTQGEIHRILIPPLLFISFLQYAVNTIKENEYKETLIISFQVLQKQLIFSCNGVDKAVEKSSFIQKAKERLSMLQTEYTLNIKNKKGNSFIVLTLN